MIKGNRRSAEIQKAVNLLNMFVLFFHNLCQGTINCAILECGIGGSGDPRRKWEEMGERESEKEGERERETCCFCLQNDLKES